MYNPWYSTHAIPEALHSSSIYIYIYSKWVDTVPLSKVRGQFPSLVTPWEGNPNLSPIRKGAVPVSNQKTAGHSLQSVDQWSQSPICRPVQITVDWPINRLSSRDGTYISVSCNDHNTFQYTNPFQYFNITSTSSTPTIPFNITMSTFQYFPSTYSPTSQIQHLILLFLHNLSNVTIRTLHMCKCHTIPGFSPQLNSTT